MSEPMPQLFLQSMSDSKPENITLENEEGKILYHHVNITDVNGVYRSPADVEVSFTLMGTLADAFADLADGRCRLCCDGKELNVQIRSISFHKDVNTAYNLGNPAPIFMDGMVTATLTGVLYNSEDVSGELTSSKQSEELPHTESKIKDAGYDNPFELLDFSE